VSRAQEKGEIFFSMPSEENGQRNLRLVKHISTYKVLKLVQWSNLSHNCILLISIDFSANALRMTWRSDFCIVVLCLMISPSAEIFIKSSLVY